MYEIDDWWEPIEQLREHYSMLCDDLNEKDSQKKEGYM